jgi:hypothetical protein
MAVPQNSGQLSREPLSILVGNTRPTFIRGGLLFLRSITTVLDLDPSEIEAAVNTIHVLIKESVLIPSRNVVSPLSRP